MNNMDKKVLLYSGGMDSWLIDKLWKPDIKLYVNIHGDYSASEIIRLPEDVVVVDCPFIGQFENHKNKFVPLRNLYFLMIASNYGNRICLGATGGDWGNRDKTPEFLKSAEHLLNYLWEDKKTKRHIQVDDGFIYTAKSDLIRQYLKLGGTIEELKNHTFSCYTPVDGEECLSCYPCFRKFALLYANGAIYSIEQRRRMWEYVSTTILPSKEEGGYPGTYYTDRGKESVDLISAVNMLREEFE